ncbi:unnamed protein product [Dimorphilus gyrociliatus]|uniref:Uncharacterized protein n=1 Tax=Dimorphilus gyrociliatus TaxID=2664684 RepID=A0A7I8W9M7_9ANNE|nr:unnamed protein product [Dimorphilus gyrociliatus]
MLISVSILFWFTYLPVAVWFLYFKALGYMDASAHPEDLEFAKMGHTILTLISFANTAGNFFLYCLTGQRFRQELGEMLGIKRNSKVKEVGNSSVKTVSQKL